MEILEHYLFRQKAEKKSDTWVELSIIKEYLVEEQSTLSEEKYKIEDLDIKEHYKNILGSKIDNRKRQITNLLERTIYRIKQESESINASVNVEDNSEDNSDTDAT